MFNLGTVTRVVVVKVDVWHRVPVKNGGHIQVDTRNKWKITYLFM